MKLNKGPSENLSGKKVESALEKEKAIEEYILGTLFYTPKYYVKNEDSVSINVYAPGKNQPSMKIFRMIIRKSPLPNTPEDYQEVAFQDEVNVLKEKGMNLMERWQINFSIFVDKEKYEYKSIKERPKSVSYVSESMRVFTDLSKQKGAHLYAGNQRFESDGNGWVPTNDDGSKTISQSEVKSLMPTPPSLDK